MSLASEMVAAASEAQGYLAQLQGMAEGAAGNFVGPDGRTYTLVFRSADAMEGAASGMDMQGHGFGDKSLVIATGARSQFDAVPYSWRRAHGTRLVPQPTQDFTILSVAIDDPLHYVFAMVFRQPAASNG